MLKITDQRNRGREGVSLVVEGRLAGPWVKELETYYHVLSGNQHRCTMIDLTGVTFIDSAGKALLACLWRQGAELRATGCLTRCVIQEITSGSRFNPSSQTDDQCLEGNAE